MLGAETTIDWGSEFYDMLKTRPTKKCINKFCSRYMKISQATYEFNDGLCIKCGFTMKNTKDLFLENKLRKAKEDYEKVQEQFQGRE